MAPKLQHIIDNDEIGLSYCGRLLPYVPLNVKPTDIPTPWRMPNGDVAIWDNDQFLGGFSICQPCSKAYDDIYT